MPLAIYTRVEPSRLQNKEEVSVKHYFEQVTLILDLGRRPWYQTNNLTLKNTHVKYESSRLSMYYCIVVNSVCSCKL